MAAAAPPGSSLREQLCQIEQSLGVCHIAEVQLWPGCSGASRPPLPKGGPHGPRWSSTGARPPSTGKPPSSRPVVGVRLSPTPKPGPSPTRSISADSTGWPRLGGRHAEYFAETGSPRYGARQTKEEDNLASSHNSPAKWRQDAGDLDPNIMEQLDAAAARLVDDAANRLPGLVALGPPSPPRPATLCGRLPQQLADVRSHLRSLSSHCDSMNAIAAAAFDKGNPDDFTMTLESMVAAHASAMGLARNLLADNSRADPGLLHVQLPEAMNVAPAGLQQPSALPGLQ